MEKLYGTQDVARMCQVAQGTVIRWIKEGKLTAALTAGGHHRIQSADLEQFLKNLRIPVPSEVHASEKKRVLIADDEKEVRRLVRWVIEQNFQDVQIEEAEEGFVAGWKAHEFLPDLVILDLLLPGLDGFRVCEYIRSFSPLKDIRVIAISALMDQAIEKKFITLGAQEILAKPFDPELLKAKIAKCLGLNGGSHD